MLSPAELLDLLADRAPKLRKLGVQSFELDANGGLRATFEPAELEPQAPAATEAAPKLTADPMKDPATWGLPPGAKLPGFTRDEPRRTDADDDQ